MGACSTAGGFVLLQANKTDTSQQIRLQMANPPGHYDFVLKQVRDTKKSHEVLEYPTQYL